MGVNTENPGRGGVLFTHLPRFNKPPRHYTEGAKIVGRSKKGHSDDKVPLGTIQEAN